MKQAFDFTAVDKIIDEIGAQPSSIIAILQGIQEKYRYLPQEVFPYMAERLGVSEARIYSVATFYENFSFDPKGKYVIKVCDGTACHVRKSVPVREALEKHLGLGKGKQTTDDMMFTIEIVSCLGACGLAPVMTVNDKVHPKMTPDKAVEIIDELKEGECE